MNIEPATRRANFWLFVGLVLFAVVLCAVVLLWMRARTQAQGGKVYPPVSEILFCHPERSGAKSKDLANYYPRSFGFWSGVEREVRVYPGRGPSTPLRSAQDDRGFEFAGYLQGSKFAG